MNLKQYYYRSYFKNLDLRQPVLESERDNIKKKNEPKLKAHNHTLTEFLPRLASKDTQDPGYALPPGNVSPLCLFIEGTGLIPGIGYPHEVSYAGEFKLGMHFDHTTGLPSLPGSSVKGALRALWPQYGYAETQPGLYRPDTNPKKPGKAELQGKKARFIFKLLQAAKADLSVDEKEDEEVLSFVHRLELALFEGWEWGADAEKTKLLPMSKRAVFFDALPIAPATTRYGKRLLGRDALTPHGDNPLKNPIPLPFMKVLPGVEFAFSFRLHSITIGDNSISTQNLLDLFAVLLEKSGAGAKTNVGYGRFAKEAAALPLAQGTPADARPAAGRQPDPRPEPPKPKPPAKLEYSKSLGGKEVSVKILAIEGETIQYELENVLGAEGVRSLTHDNAQILKVGSRYQWRVSEANPDKNILKIKINNFKPLDT